MNLSKINENVLAGFDHWVRVTSCALGVGQIHSIDKLATAIALITLCVRVITAFVRTATTDHAVSQWCDASVAVLLFKVVLISIALSVQVIENVLCNFSLLLGGSAAKMVEIAVKPLIYLSVQSMVMVANLLTGLTFLTSLRFRGSSILICTADVESIVASEAGVSSIYIS